MKKVILFMFCLCPVLAWSEGNNNIKMVTYFPIPYMAVSDLDVKEALNVGIGNSWNAYMSNLSVTGSDASDGYVDAKPSTLTFTIPAGSKHQAVVSANEIDITGYSSLGSSSYPTMSFKGDLTIREIGLSNNHHHVYNLTANTNAKMQKLFLNSFDAASFEFPACASDKQVYWEKLTIDGKKRGFLVCHKYGALKKCRGIGSVEEHVKYDDGGQYKPAGEGECISGLADKNSELIGESIGTDWCDLPLKSCTDYYTKANQVTYAGSFWGNNGTQCYGVNGNYDGCSKELQPGDYTYSTDSPTIYYPKVSNRCKESKSIVNGNDYELGDPNSACSQEGKGKLNEVETCTVVQAVTKDDGKVDKSVCVSNGAMGPGNSAPTQCYKYISVKLNCQKRSEILKQKYHFEWWYDGSS